MTQFNRKQLDTLRKQMQNALNMFADFDNTKVVIGNNIKIEVGNCSYRGGEATYKVKVLMEGAKTREQIDLEYYADMHDIDTTTIAQLQGDDMKIIGYKSRARKKPWILQRLRDGAEFVCSDHTAKQFFKKREEIA